MTYGATSFVGAIHVVRSGAASRSTYAGLRGGSFGSGGVFADLPLFQRREWSSRLSVDANRQGYPDDRTGYDRGHFLWRTQRERGGGSKMWFHADGAWVNQDPSSPLPADGGRFLDDFSIDANFNPRHSYLDDRRFTAGFGCDRAFGAARWSLQSSVSRANQEIFRGFLGDPIAPGVSQGNGIRESIDRTDIYVDTHWTLAAARNVSLVLGGDLLHGQAKAEGAEFDYRVRIDGSHAASVSEPGDLPIRIDDRRDFLGAYGLAEWAATKRLRVSGGLRVNATLEEREGEADATPAPGMEEETLRQSNLRLSGSAGLLYSLWERRADHFRLYGNYRDTFKPAAIDFGIGEEPGGGEAELLDPETSRSVEVGAKSTFGAGRYSVEGGLFWMELRNLVTATSVNGLPALVNAGRERFRGVETAGDVRLGHDVGLRATYSFHDATFRDFVQDFGGVPTQLAGNRLEMSARHLASAGVVHAPDHGILLLAELQYVGSRYLNRRNTSLAEPFTTLGAGIGYRFDRWEVRLDARNLTDERPPVSESELGDGQYYPLPARRVDFSVAARF